MEEHLLNGTFHPKNGLPSVALFTLHKAGSTFLSERLASLCTEKKFLVADFEHYMIRKGLLYENAFAEESVCRLVFSVKGVFHKAIRIPVNPDWLGGTKVLLVTRDPRDIATSFYFSLKHSHVIYNESGRKERRRLESTSIDQFILESTYFESAVLNLEKYRPFFSLGDRFLHVSYETVVTRPEFACAQITSFLGFSPRRGKLFSANDFMVSREDVMSHRRQILPGDHARKLSPETIRCCNERIRPLASFYGWQNVD